jgi:hypothetical protein
VVKYAENFAVQLLTQRNLPNSILSALGITQHSLKAEVVLPICEGIGISVRLSTTVLNFSKSNITCEQVQNVWLLGY